MVEVKRVIAYFSITYLRSISKYFSSFLLRNTSILVFYGIYINLLAAIMLNVFPNVFNSDGLAPFFLKILTKITHDGQQPSNTDASTDICFIGLYKAVPFSCFSLSSTSGDGKGH